MNTKTCKGCGWVYPITQPGTICKICRTPFDIVVCRMCGEVVSGDKRVKNTNLCRACFYSVNKVSTPKSLAKRKKRLDDKFDCWIARVKSVPKEYPTLTEEQWLAACAHFDGCARCHSKDLDTRGFFISAALGGRYCDWNIIPLCERCASRWDLNKSVFNYVISKDYTESVHGEYIECLDKIVEYLEVKLDAAVNYTATIDTTTDRS